MIYPHELKSYFVTNRCMGDGFGSQYHHIVAYLLFCYHFDLDFVYSPITRIEHNYDNDPEYVEKLENLMNIRSFFTTIGDPSIDRDITDIYDKAIGDDFHVKYMIDQNVDKFATEESLGKLRTIFWSNKERHTNDKTIVTVHIRRPNAHDGGFQDRMNLDNQYYLNAMQRVREEHKDKDLQFHIYSQGELSFFDAFLSKDTVLHIDEDLEKTFVDLVAADILITCSSALSYVAAFLNDGIVYYTEHCHPPRSTWIRL